MHFPVLFPGLDAANHSPESKVDWTFGAGYFSIATSTDMQVEAGAEVFNNYGPKSNGELLLGYGFCIPDNPHDCVAMTLKAPPPALRADLKAVHRGYFSEDGFWNATKATFDLKRPTTTTQSSSGLRERPQIFHQLPEPLLELLVYILRHERGLHFDFLERPLKFLTDPESDGRRYLPHIARMITHSLAPKLAKLRSASLPYAPQNAKQTQASIYRQGQVDILISLLSAFRRYTHSLVWTPSSDSAPAVPIRGPCLITLESFLPLLLSTNVIDSTFLAGIKANANTDDLEQLRLAGWEEDVWALLVCNLLLESDELPRWLWQALPEYIDQRTPETPDGVDPVALEQANALLPVCIS